MKALMHIGPAKTGTTSIQAFLRLNRNTLLENRVGNLAHGQWPKKISALFRKKTPGTPWAKSRGILDPKKFASFKRKTIEHLRQEISELKGKSDLMIFSSEGLFNFAYKEIFDLKTFLDQYFESTEIIAYLRRQDIVHLSKQKNLVRNQHFTKPVVTKHYKYYDYWRNLSKWLLIFGKQSICVRIFPDSYPDPEPKNLIGDFISQISERVGKLNGTFLIPDNRNASWDWKAIEFVRIANRVSPEIISKPVFHDAFVRLIDKLYRGGEKPTLSRETAISIVSIYAKSNKRVRDVFRPDLESLFHDDFSSYPKNKMELQLTTENAVKIAMQLIFEAHFKESSNTLDSNGTFLIPENRNIGWDWKAIEFVRSANRISPDIISKPEFHDAFVQLIDKLYRRGEKPALSRETAISIVSNYAKSNKRVRGVFRTDLEKLSHEDFSSFPKNKMKQQLTTENAVKIAMQLIFAAHCKKTSNSLDQNIKFYEKTRPYVLIERLKKTIYRAVIK